MIISFKSAKEMERWLSRNHSKSNGIWLRMFNKNSGIDAIKGPEALDVALCYGWITGQARANDGISVLWRFCPRRPKSMWSKLNTQHAERLIREGRMKASGFRQIEEAKRDGRWARAYSPQRTAKIPRDFARELSRNGKAREFFKTLNRSSVYAIIFRLENTRNPELRRQKISSIVEMLGRGEKFR